MTADDVPDIEGPQRFDGLRNDVLHHAAEMQPAHDGMNGDSGEELADVGADIDDSGMRAGAEDDEAQPAQMRGHEALVHQEGIGLPGRLAVGPAEMIGASGLEGGDPRDLAAVVEMPVQKQALLGVVHHHRAMRLHFLGRRDIGDRNDLAVSQFDPALVEHAGVHMHARPAPVGGNGVEGGDQRPHMVPMPMGHGDGFHIAQLDGEIAAVADEGGALGAGIEQHGVVDPARARSQPQAIAEIGREK